MEVHEMHGAARLGDRALDLDAEVGLLDVFNLGTRRGIRRFEV